MNVQGNEAWENVIRSDEGWRQGRLDHADEDLLTVSYCGGMAILRLRDWPSPRPPIGAAVAVNHRMGVLSYADMFAQVEILVSTVRSAPRRLGVLGPFIAPERD